MKKFVSLKDNSCLVKLGQIPIILNIKFLDAIASL